MSKLTFLTVALTLSAVCFIARGQQTTPLATHIGTAKGIARDTAQNYVLQSATVSVYKAADSTLLSYQVTNNYGEFSFKNLPVDLPLRLEISHLGYMTARKDFKIPSDKNTVNLQTIIVNRKDIMLDDVVISVPPITMNGDTLEFNASAFKLDSNATVEDMLKAIPNVTLWGDGKITVNGAEVKSLKVNGQSFFGGAAKIALQNIPKNSLQKVYNTAKDRAKPLDSTLEMNIKLKKGKDIGFFGKIGAGYGTHDRFETDANINMFSPKMQLALIGAINNVNKTPNSISSLMANSTFKGVGTNVEYQPDFRMPGINRPSAAGASLTYNFIENPTYEKKSTLRSNYFIQGVNSDLRSDILTTTSVNSTEKVFENNKINNSTNNTIQRFDSDYEFAKMGQTLRLSQSVDYNKGKDIEQTNRTAGNLQNPLTSTNNTLNTNNYTNRSLNFQGAYQYSPYYSQKNFRGFSVEYKLTSYNNDSERSNITQFRSFTNAAENQDFNRKYNTNSDATRQAIDFTLSDVKTLLFGNDKLRGINFDVTNKLILMSDKNDNRVQDLDTLSNTYRPNTYLNNQIRTNLTEETPGLKIQKGFYKGLSNRYNTNLTLSFHPKLITISQDNKSDRSFQNINRNYKRFVPDASINYGNNQYGEYYRSYNLNYTTTLQIPTIQQLAPLTDSTNLYNLQRGNVNLKAAVQQQISLNFSHYDQGNKNTLNYNFQATVGVIKDNIVDSLLIDDQNRRTAFLVNADGNKFLNFNGGIEKAFKLKSSELQLRLNTGINANKNPGYTNDIFTFSSNFNTNSNANVNFTYKSYLGVELGQSYSTYRSKQEAFDTKYSGKNLGTTMSASYNITKKFTINSNVTFNNSSSSNAADINFTIWNANAVYRFLKGNNAEIKFLALDLLRQNTNVINYGGSNSFTIGTQNVLQQYFMTTISYYPRQFGKKGKLKK
jgi:hypothetical protein